MHIAIFGQPQSGKSTVFEALTGISSEPVGSGQPLATVKVPDPRLDKLSAQFKPRKTIPADVSFLDVRPVGVAFSKTEGLSAGYIDALSKADALLLVVRAFADESVVHMEGTVDPWRDAAAMLEEVTFTDQLLLSKRLERIDATIGKTKPADREVMERERGVLRRLLDGLDEGVPVRDQPLDEEERKLIRHYRFLTEKPLLVVVNIGEEQITEAADFEARLGEHVSGDKVRAAAIAGKIERELSQLEGEDADEFRQSLDLAEPARDRILREAFRLLGLISFFTVGPDECRAWTIPAHTPAPRAASTIHTDIERGFIRAEVVPYEDLLSAGTMAEARKRAVLRSEGKTYIVKDGDVIEYLFNV